MVTVESIAFRQGRELANSLHSSFVALLDLTMQPRSFIPYFRLVFSFSLMFVAPVHTLFTALARGSADKAGHLTHSFKAYSPRKRTTNILINHTPQIFAAVTTQPQLNREPSAAVEHPIPP